MAIWQASRVSRMDARLLAPLQLEMDEGVRTQPQAERLQRDHVAWRHVGEIDVAAGAGHEEGLQLLGRRFEDEPPAVGAAVDDLLDDVEAGLPAWVADAAATAFPCLGHDEGRSGREVLLDEGHPLIAGQRGRALSVLVAHLAQDNELLGGAGDELRLSRGRQMNRAVRDFDITAAVPLAEVEVILDEILSDELLEEGAAEEVANAVLLQAGHLLFQARGDERRAPAKLDEVDAAGRAGDRVLEYADGNAVVDDDGEPFLARLHAAKGHAEWISVHSRFLFIGADSSCGLAAGRGVMSCFRR